MTGPPSVLMLQEVCLSCCEFERAGDMIPELELRNTHGVMGLHREFYQVF